MGGQISVQTQKGRGSTFTVDLELQLSEATDNASFWEQHQILRILVVDDSEQVCRDIALSMKKYGVQVSWALSGKAAIQLVRDDPDFDVVLIDWYMTSMSGRQTAIALRNFLFRFLSESSFAQMGFGKADFRRLCQSMMELDFTEAARSISCPALILCGQKDSANQAASAKLAGLLQNATFLELPGVGHESNVEAPEKLASAIRAFQGKVSLPITR